MPRLPIDYSKTVIYKLVCNDLSITESYVGSTTDFVRRKAGHKSDCTNEKGPHYNYKVYKIIRDNGGWAEWCMVEIEKYPCNDANEATSRERYWFGIMNSNLNTIYPHRTRAQYRADNKESISNGKKARIVCSTCGTTLSNHALVRHLRTDRHISAITAIEVPAADGPQPNESLR